MSRWSKELDDKLRELFQEGLADPRKQDSKYIKEVFEKTDWLKDYKVKNFYPLYRRKADEWTIEQSKSGARRSTKKKAAPPTKERRPDTNTRKTHPSDNKDDSSVEQEAESLGSNDTSEDEDSTKSDKEDNDIEDIDEEDELKEGMATMSVKAQATIKLPMLIYTWNKDRQECCSIDILLLSGITNDDIDCKIDKSGKYVTVDILLPDFFLSSRRLQAASGGQISQHHSKTSALDKAIDDFRESFNFEEPTLSFKIKLPFKVDNSFFKEVVWYRHDDEALRNDSQFYYMLHVELTSATKPRELSTQIGRRVVDTPVSTPPRPQQQQPQPQQQQQQQYRGGAFQQQQHYREPDPFMADDE